MLMAWGPFRFTIPRYSVEAIRRAIEPRVAPQPVIGATPPVHRLGPGNEKVSLESTFHPHHLNGRGLSQLMGVRQAVNSLTPYMLVHMNSSTQNVFGMWIATGLEDEQTMFDARGVPQAVTTTLSLMQYGGGGGRAAAMAVALGNSDISFSLRLGF